MAAAVYPAAGERDDVLSLPLGLEPIGRICRDRHQEQNALLAKLI